MARYTRRKLEVFSLHAHITNHVTPDYAEVFDFIASIEGENRIAEVGRSVMAVSDQSWDGRLYEFSVVEGDLDVVPLVFDTETAAERLIELSADEVVVTKTYGLIDTNRREAIVMYNHRGAKAKDISVLLQTFMRRREDWGYSELSLVPVADQAFVDALDEFERIRLASATFARPNIDWTETSERLLEGAEESSAQKVAVELTAHRAGGLNANRGFVAALKRLLRQERATVVDAQVRGTREAEEAETAIYLRHHVTHQRVNLRLDEDGQIESEDVQGKIRSFLEGRTQRD